MSAQYCRVSAHVVQALDFVEHDLIQKVAEFLDKIMRQNKDIDTMSDSS